MRPERPDGMTPDWPVEEAAPPVKRDWRDTLRNAADLALLGIVTTVAALPLVTAGAAVSSASAAVHQWAEYRSWPGIGVTAQRFVRGILPGLAATVLAAGFALLMLLNMRAITAGAVPGGSLLVAASALLLLAAVGLFGLTVVEVGRQDGKGWSAAMRAAAQVTQSRPTVLLASAGVIALTITLGVTILPILVPILIGYALLALHAVHRRLAPQTGS